jgi:hypothetical protein
MPKKARRAVKKAKPIWERGYRSHGYWLGKQRLGKVTLDGDAEDTPRYRWESGNRAGKSQTLREAKQAVEQAVLIGARQLGLFDSDT